MGENPLNRNGTAYHRYARYSLFSCESMSIFMLY
nr:MAG TPA: hypothetical protein [Caudoviricetes sp.]